MTKGKKRLFLFFLVNGISAFLWIKISATAYEVGGYLKLFGLMQAAITLCLLPAMFSKGRNYVPHTLLTVMQLCPIICYTIFQGADGGWISIFSVLCLLIGVYVLCTKESNK